MISASGSPLDPLMANVAKTMRLNQKGRIAPSLDADVVCLNENNKVHHVLCHGQWMVRSGEIVRPGTFERKENT